jgi:hypothetical protein
VTQQDDAPKKAAPPVDENLPDKLSMSEIQGGLGKVKGKASACYSQFNVPGTVMVNLSIGGNGHVSASHANGQFAGTPTGECVARAARSAVFPRFKGPNISIDYPFVLNR